jgi:hypothetical protein
MKNFAVLLLENIPGSNCKKGQWLSGFSDSHYMFQQETERLLYDEAEARKISAHLQELLKIQTQVVAVQFGAAKRT